MTDIVKLTNDISSLYEQGLIEKGEMFICPVCSKEYKQKKSADKHIEKQDCFSMQDLFADTEYEKNSLVFFRSILSETNPTARMTLSTFRKSKSYGPVLRFILFTSYHDITDKGLYYSWLNEIVGFKFMNKILSEGIKETRLRDFRKFLIKNDTLIDSDSFFDRYRDDLIEDQHFFIRSIEKGHVSINYLSVNRDFPFDDVCANLYHDYYVRLMEIIDGT